MKQFVDSEWDGDISDGGEFLGYGYDYFGYYANLASLKNGEIFSMGKILKVQAETDDRLINEVAIGQSSEKTRTGTSLSEFTSNFNVKASVSGGYMGFTAEVGASFGQSYSETGEDEYAQFSYHVLQKRKVITQAVIDDYDEFLTSAARKAINGTSTTYKGEKGIAKLIENYGTHVVVSGYVGGRVDYSMMVRRTAVEGAYNLEAYLKAGYKGFFSADVSVETQYSESYKKNQSNCEISINTIGGNMRVSKQEDLSQWHTNVVNGAGVLMEFDSNSLLPIWELCEDEERAKAIEEYVLGGYYDQKIESLFTTELKKVGIWPFNTGYAVEDQPYTLIHRATIDGVPVAEICYEYIPGISQTGGVMVVYPVINGTTCMDRGLFVGNSHSGPAYVIWEEGAIQPRLEPIADAPVGTLEAVYVKGRNITTTVPAGNKKIINTTREPYYVKGYYSGLSNNYSYAVVKIANKVWMREDFQGSSTYDATLFEVKDKKFYGYIATFYPNSLRTPANWELPNSETVAHLKQYLKEDMSLLRGINSLTGFDTTLTYYYEGTMKNNFVYYWMSGVEAMKITESAWPAGNNSYLPIRFVRKE